MYEHILVTLDATAADRTILEHIVPLATMCQSKVTLLHVADGWAARTHGSDAVSPEVTEDRAYLAKVKDELQSKGVSAEAELAFGDPATEIIKWVKKRGCSLIAMSTHGHRFLADFFLGTAADTVRHEVEVPVLLIKAKY
jgi:nucleotide-binding universal stress UspA family protein